MKLLTVNNLSAGYNGTDIIKNISFSVDSGQIIGILGKRLRENHLDQVPGKSASPYGELSA